MSIPNPRTLRNLLPFEFATEGGVGFYALRCLFL